MADLANALVKKFTQNANLPWSDPAPEVQKLLRLRGRGEERAMGYRTQNTVTVLQRGAEPAQERNEINGRDPPPAGRTPVYVGLDVEQA